MRKLSVVAALAAVLLLAACGSGGLGDLGGIFGTPQTSSTGTNPGTIGATVNFVDASNQRIDVRELFVAMDEYGLLPYTLHVIATTE